MTPVAQRVGAVLADFLDEQERFWSGTPETTPVFATLRRFVLDGGKRLRPAFCYWGWRAATDSPAGDDAAVITAGAALELFHCFALIHDDVIDESQLRRGHPTVHEDFAQRHTESGLRGDGEAYGRGVALLCGDLCAAWADQLLARCAPVPAPWLRRAQSLFAQTRAEAIAGEYLDMVAQAHGADDTEAAPRALRVARLKTARYSIARPLQIGGALAGADDDLLRAYGAIGEPLGVAFQLRDDLLGVFGDPSRTGKSALDDLRHGKATMLLAVTFTRCGDRAPRLHELIGDPALDETGAQEIKDLMLDCGALDVIEQRIHHEHRLAVQAIETLPITPDTRDALLTLAELATARAH